AKGDSDCETMLSSLLLSGSTVSSSFIAASKLSLLRNPNQSLSLSRNLLRSFKPIKCSSADSPYGGNVFTVWDPYKRLGISPYASEEEIWASCLGSMPTAEGAVSDLFGKPFFLFLYDWFMEHGGVYKLAFGPKAFVVISDPTVAACPQRERGVLAEILEPVMEKGLIPADLDTWKLRRRAITHAFHALYLEAMVKVFSNCSEKMILKSEKLLREKEV
ncbi:hypothetical protein HID58_052263, partial [Brassica napus]